MKLPYADPDKFCSFYTLPEHSNVFLKAICGSNFTVYLMLVLHHTFSIHITITHSIVQYTPILQENSHLQNTNIQLSNVYKINFHHKT
jgi:hypothetical protein